MNSSGIFLVIVTLANVMFAVNAGCVDRPEAINSTAESAMDKVSNFFMEVGCTFRSGAEKVKERVESGYNYLKSKITPDEFKNSTTQNDVKANIPNDDRITFKDSPEDGLIEYGMQPTAEIETTTIEVASSTLSSINGVNNTGVTIDDRTALTAPEMCPQGEVKINGKCRKDIDL